MSRQVENWIASYLQMVEETEPPQRFHLWSAVTVIGAMLGRKCTAKLGPETFFPNLYTVLIGPPGVRKGTAIKYITDLLAEVQQTSGGSCRAPDAVTKEQLVAEMEAAQDTSNIDGKTLVHSSLFVVAPELVVFIKENDHERLGYLCQLYDGLDRFDYKTKTSKNSYVVNPGLWLLGATTPNWIEIAMKQLGIGGGMTSRTIFVHASKKGKHISVTKMKPFNQDLKAKLVLDLQEIKQLAGQFTVTPEGSKEFTDWYEGRYLQTGIDDSRFDSYWERYPSMVVKVAMIISASKRDDMLINEKDILGAIGLFENIHPEMPQAFGGLGQNVLGSQTEMIRQILRDKGSVPRSYIMRTLRNQISEWDYQRCRNSLLAEKFCSRKHDQDLGEEVLTICEQCPVVSGDGDGD